MPEEDAYQPNMWLHPFFACVSSCMLSVLFACVSNSMFYNSFKFGSAIFCVLFFCFLLMKLSPNIRQSPPPKWSDSLYYYNGRKKTNKILENFRCVLGPHTGSVPSTFRAEGKVCSRSDHQVEDKMASCMGCKIHTQTIGGYAVGTPHFPDEHLDLAKGPSR
jgi:hypothetical protein